MRRDRLHLTGSVGYPERALVVATFVLGASAFFPVFDGSVNNLNPAARDPLTEHLWWAIYAGFVATLIMARSQRLLWAAAARVPLLSVLVGWAVLSRSWSLAPTTTDRRSIALILTTAVGLYLAQRLTQREFIDLLAIALTLIIVASALVAIFAPSHGLDSLRGDGWRGVLATKNGLGRIACLSMVVSAYRIRAYGARLLAGIPVVVLSFLDLYASHSRTSLVVAILMSAILLFAPALQGDFRIATAAAMLIVSLAGICSWWLAMHSEAVLSAFGSSTTLTGRTSIWSAAWYMAKQHFWFGYGYNAFWTGINGPSGVLWGIVGSDPPHAHNGFLDTWLDLGAVGVALLVIFLLRSVFRAWLAMRSGIPSEFWPLLFLAYLIAFNLSESSFLVRNSIFWILFVVASVWSSVSTERPSSGVSEDALREPRASLSLARAEGTL